MAQVVVEHERAQPQPLGHHRHGRQQRDRPRLRRQVIVDGEVAVPDCFGGSRVLEQRLATLHAAGAEQEPKGPHRASMWD